MHKLLHLVLEIQTFEPVLPLSTLPLWFECQRTLSIVAVDKRHRAEYCYWLGVLVYLHVWNKIHQEVVNSVHVVTSKLEYLYDFLFLHREVEHRGLLQIITCVELHVNVFKHLLKLSIGLWILLFIWLWKHSVLLLFSFVIY